jgi:peptide/nickel transport system substrate-binding protein
MARIFDYIPLIHPVQIGTGNQELMATAVFSMLIHVKSDETTLEPDLATSWTASPDATTYTFHLDPRAVWSDGQPVTTTDVIYTIAWANQNPDAYKEDSIQAFTEVKGGAAVKGTTNIPSGLVATDAHTITITLAAPDSIWLRNIAVAPYIILPDHILHNLTAAQADNCQFCLGTPGVTIGSGPYDFATQMNAQGAEFVAKKNWWKGPVNIQRIDYKIQDSAVSVAQLEAGELDFVIRVPPDAGPDIAKVPGLKELNEAGVGIFALNFNNTSIPDARVRQAVAYAINRPQIVQQVLGGRATLNYTIPPGFQVYSDINKYDFNPTMAKQLLAAAGWDPNRSFNLYSLSDDPNFTTVAPVIQQELQQIGMKVNLVAEPDAQFIDDTSNHPEKYDAYFSFGGSEGVGWYQSRAYYNCQAGTNFIRLQPKDCVYDTLFAQAQATTDPTTQGNLIHQIALLLNKNLPEIYLWQPNYLHVYTSRLGGGFVVYPNERESFADVATWTLAPLAP